MKTLIRNFLSMLRRFRAATFLNIAGLSVAFAAFLVIMMQVSYEERFDSCHPAADRVCMAELYNETQAEGRVIFPGAFPDALIQSSPHIEAGALIYPYGREYYLTVGEGAEKKGFLEKITTCQPDFIRLFGFNFIEGDPASLNDPEKAIIPLSLARRMFGDASAVGKRIQSEESIWTKNRDALTVGAVYADFPDNTQLDNSIYSGIDMNTEGMDQWGQSNYFCYLLLDDAASLKEVEETFNRTFDFSLLDRTAGQMKLRLLPIRDIHYLDTKDIWGADHLRTGSPDTTLLLFFIGLLILLIAAINYMNFSTALTPMRIRSINTQKVMGSADGTLRASLLVEAAGVCLLAYGLSLLLIYTLVRLEMLSFVEADIRIGANLPLVAVGAILALAVGVLAGLYPSFYITSFPPALVLKGSFGLSPSGRKLRTVLIGCQYVISIGLIVGACFIQLQDRYMRHFSLGFDSDQIAVVTLNKTMCRDNKEAYVDRLMTSPEVEGVAFSAMKLGSRDTYSTYGFKHNEEEFAAFVLAVSPEFLKVMGIPVTEGTDFSPSEGKDGSRRFIFNETARKANSLALGETVDMGWGPDPVIGFTDDITFTSLRDETQNMTFVVRTDVRMPVSYIRLRAGSDVEQAVKHIREVVAGFDPAYPVDVEFYDTFYNQLYQREAFVKKMVTSSSVLAILISIVGVFGLVLFETQYRRKEIGIRKVHGATIGDILSMFNRKYLYIVTACFVLATPVAWWGTEKWLQNFAYKTPLHGWVFVFAFLLVLSVTLFTVSFQNWRTARENPVESLKSE